MSGAKTVRLLLDWYFQPYGCSTPPWPPWPLGSSAAIAMTPAQPAVRRLRCGKLYSTVFSRFEHVICCLSITSRWTCRRFCSIVRFGSVVWIPQLFVDSHNSRFKTFCFIQRGFCLKKVLYVVDWYAMYQLSRSWTFQFLSRSGVRVSSTTQCMIWRLGDDFFSKGKRRRCFSLV